MVSLESPYHQSFFFLFFSVIFSFSPSPRKGRNTAMVVVFENM